MRKTIIAASLASAAFAVPNLAAAQAAPAAAPAAAPSDHTLTGNAGLFSQYRFRGIMQTYGNPALQGGVDYSHSSGFYAGNWNSNVNEGAGYPGGSIEMDFYGGWKKTWGDWGIDLGGIYYYYPGTHSGSSRPFSPTNNRSGNVANGNVHNFEGYVAGSWKFITLKYSRAFSDYFQAPNTDGSGYLDLSANYDLGDGWGVNGHVGHLNFKNMSRADYTDWKLGVTKDISGWVFGAAYVDTNAHGSCGKGEFYCFPNSSGTNGKNAGKATAVLSVSKTF
jgi:uncharacterized protein (TIGR02001 family)